MANSENHSAQETPTKVLSSFSLDPEATRKFQRQGPSSGTAPAIAFMVMGTSVYGVNSDISYACGFMVGIWAYGCIVCIWVYGGIL